MEKNYNVAIVVARFNSNVTEKLVEGAMQRLQEHGFSSNQITVVPVPGAVEIPITVQRLAQTKRYAVIITFGAVIFGETPHFDYVCDQVSQGCQQVALKYDLPVIFGVLTTHNMEQALDRAGGKKSHVGREAADAAVEMVETLNQI